MTMWLQLLISFVMKISFAFGVGLSMSGLVKNGLVFATHTMYGAQALHHAGPSSRAASATAG